MPRQVPYIVQTCDAGKHRRKDRPNGGMYIGVGEVNLVLAAMAPRETLIVQRRKVRPVRSSSFGVSLDLFYGCPAFKEVSPVQVVCTSPGRHIGVVSKKKEKHVPPPLQDP